MGSLWVENKKAQVIAAKSSQDPAMESSGPGLEFWFIYQVPG